jgi:hypothetical protein
MSVAFEVRGSNIRFGAGAPDQRTAVCVGAMPPR